MYTHIYTQTRTHTQKQTWKDKYPHRDTCMEQPRGMSRTCANALLYACTHIDLKSPIPVCRPTGTRTTVLQRWSAHTIILLARNAEVCGPLLRVVNNLKERVYIFSWWLPCVSGTFSLWCHPKFEDRCHSVVEFIERAIMHSKNGKFLYFLRSRVPGKMFFWLLFLGDFIRWRCTDSIDLLFVLFPCFSIVQSTFCYSKYMDAYTVYMAIQIKLTIISSIIIIFR